MGPCMCGDPECPACGPAQGLGPTARPPAADLVVGVPAAPGGDLRLRRHGMGGGGAPLGPPTWRPAAAGVPPCPHCGAQVCEVEVPVRHPLVRGGVGVSRYLGCPACPMATPAIVTASAPGRGGRGPGGAP